MTIETKRKAFSTTTSDYCEILNNVIVDCLFNGGQSNMFFFFMHGDESEIQFNRRSMILFRANPSQTNRTKTHTRAPTHNTHVI